MEANGDVSEKAHPHFAITRFVRSCGSMRACRASAPSCGGSRFSPAAGASRCVMRLVSRAKIAMLTQSMLRTEHGLG